MPPAVAGYYAVLAVLLYKVLCYVLHFLCSYIDSEVFIKCHFIKILLINKSMKFFDLHSIFKINGSVIYFVPNYFNYTEIPKH